MGSNAARFVLALGDLHSFHAVGLTPKDFQISTGLVLPLNFAQEYAYECWLDCLERLPERIDVLTLNGDLAEGQNLAQEARLLSEVDPTFQSRGVSHLLRPIVKRVPFHNLSENPFIIVGGEMYLRDDPDIERHIYMQQGSNYHTGRGAAIEERIGETLHARKGKDGHYVQPWRSSLFIDDVMFDIAHNQSVVSRYRSMPLDREIGFMLERIGRAWIKGLLPKRPKKIVIIRSHAHYGFRVLREENIIAISLPSWKQMDGFISRGKMVNRYVPENIGCVGFWIQGGEVEIVDDYLYPHPQPHWEVI